MNSKEVVISSLSEPIFVENVLKFLSKTGVKQIVYITYGPAGEARAFKKITEVKELLKKRQRYEDAEIGEMKNEWRLHFSYDGSFIVSGSQKFVSDFLASLQGNAKVKFDVHTTGEKKPRLALLELKNEEEELYFCIQRGVVLMDLLRKLAEHLGIGLSKIQQCRFYNLQYDKESYDRVANTFNTMQVFMTKESCHALIANTGGSTNWGLRKKLIEIVYEFCEKK